MKWSNLTKEEQERYLRFAQGSTKGDLIEFRDRAFHPEQHRLPDREIKPKIGVLKYLQQFKHGFVK
jgi:hypothetical protein